MQFPFVCLPFHFTFLFLNLYSDSPPPLTFKMAGFRGCWLVGRWGAGSGWNPSIQLIQLREVVVWGPKSTAFDIFFWLAFCWLRWQFFWLICFCFYLLWVWKNGSGVAFSSPRCCTPHLFSNHGKFTKWPRCNFAYKIFELCRADSWGWCGLCFTKCCHFHVSRSSVSSIFHGTPWCVSKARLN